MWSWSWKRVMQGCLVEFVATYLLVLVVGMTSAHESLQETALAPVVPGLFVAAMMYAGGHISRAAYNPAVTLAMCLKGRFLPWQCLVPYVVVQLVGGLLGGFTAEALTGQHVVAPHVVVGVDSARAFSAELLGSFALIFTILNVSCSLDHPGNSFYGAANGFTVIAFAIVMAPLSGSSFNPALAPMLQLSSRALKENTPLGDIWLYLLAPFVGSLLAFFVFRMTATEQDYPAHRRVEVEVEQELLLPTADKN